jgi:hypothetical protein
MEFTSFTPPERTEGDSFKPSEHIDELLIVKVTDHKHIDSTTHKPEGGPGVIADVCNLDAGGQVFRDILWMNGAIVDSLKSYVGKVLVIRFGWEKSAKSGREYIVVKSATEADLQTAQAHVAKGDPFAVQVATLAPAAASTTAAPPF